MRTYLLSALTIACTLSYVSVTEARMIAPQPIPVRVSKSDSVLIGKVTDIEKDKVKTKEGGEYAIAVVKIEDGLLGTKGLTHVKVGFVPSGGRGRVSLQAGQEVCLFLQKVPGENYYIAPMYFDVIVKQDNPNFGKETEEAKKYAEYITKIDDHLKSKDAQTRYLAAAMTIAHHRTQRSGGDKPKELDAERSKQLLEVLRDGNWKNDPAVPVQLQPLNVFLRLQLTKEEGWAPAQGGNLNADAQNWLKDNAAKYRIKSFVAEDKK